MRSGLLSELVTIGYEIFLEGDHIKLRYSRSDSPPETVRPLIDELRACKIEVMNILKMDNTIAPVEIVEPGVNTKAMWQNPYPQGTPEARQASLEVVIEAMLYGLPPSDDEQTLRIHDMVKDVVSGRAKLADLRRLLGILH